VTISLKEAGGKGKLSEWISTVPADGLKGVYLHLAIPACDDNVESEVNDIVSVINGLSIKSCSVANRDLATKILEKSPNVVILVENGDIVSGVAIERFLAAVREAPEPVGVMIKSSKVRYRFDLCVWDVWQRIKVSPNRPVAFRFRCDTTQAPCGEPVEPRIRQGRIIANAWRLHYGAVFRTGHQIGTQLVSLHISAKIGVTTLAMVCDSSSRVEKR
jgi:hypothetical protein